MYDMFYMFYGLLLYFLSDTFARELDFACSHPRDPS